MKRLLCTIFVAMLGVSSVSYAQVALDKEGLLARIEKSDAAIANPKKALKAATWLERANLFMETYRAPTAGIYRGQPQPDAIVMAGKKSMTKTTLGKVTYMKSVYPYFDAYFKDNKLAFWYTTKYVVPNALDKAQEAYLKANEIDKTPVMTQKVKNGIELIANYYKEAAGDAYAVGKNKEGAAFFKKAYETGLIPVYGIIDTVSIFNAGMLFAISNVNDQGAECLSRAIELGYDNNGESTYYLARCLMAQKKYEETKKALETAIPKYPKNIKLVEDLLNVYMITGEDTKEIIPIVSKAVEADPKNPSLYEGLGRIYEKMGDTDKAIEAFGKTAELLPNDFTANYNYGLMILRKGDALGAQMRKKTFLSLEESQKDLKAVNDVFRKSVAPLEKAHSLEPKDATVVELLKNVCFRLREDPEMKAKFEKYNEMFKTMKAPAAPAQ